MVLSAILFPFTVRAYFFTTEASRSRVNIHIIAVLAAVLFPIAAVSTQEVSAQEKPARPRAESRFGSHLPPAAVAALQGIRPDNIETHVRFLSHDLLEGRGTGQRGGDIAAEYIAAQFALYGLKPAGDNGSYLQKVPLVGITPGADTRFTLVPASGAPPSLKPIDLKPLVDYVAYDQTQQPESNVDADIVYVGYGIEAPEYNWDDYKGVAALGRSEIFRRQGAHLLRPLGLQIRRSRAQRGRRRHSHPQNRDGQLWLGSRAQFQLRREILSQTRRHSEAESGRLDPVKCRAQSLRGLRPGS
jgi:hypothetical protein